mgnify:CR=1 FL=1
MEIAGSALAADQKKKHQEDPACQADPPERSLVIARTRQALAEQTDMEAEMRRMFQIESFVDGLTGLALREHQAFTPTSNIAGLFSGYIEEGVKTVLPARAMAKLALMAEGFGGGTSPLIR